MSEKTNQLKFSGTVQNIFEVKSGITASGDAWKAVEFLVTETTEHPQSAIFKMFAVGEKLDKLENFLKYTNIGDDVDVSFNIKSKEYNGNFYNSLDAWSVFKKKIEKPF